jgi:hypothetical protein
VVAITVVAILAVAILAVATSRVYLMINGLSQIISAAMTTAAR